MAKNSSTLSNRGLIHAVARLHYIDGLSQLEVSRKMALSTATVSRLLARAREEGIVRFQVPDLDGADEFGERLRAALGLGDVRVIDAPGRGTLAALSAQVRSLLLDASPSTDPVIAIGWGRTIQGIVTAGMPKLPSATVVPAMGGMHEAEAHFQINEFARMAAEQMQAKAHFLHAPWLPSAALHRALMTDPEVARIRELWSRADIALVGIGDFKNATSNREAVMAHEGSEQISGDVVRHYFFENGQLADWSGHSNLMAISAEDLRRVPHCIAIAVGRDKVSPIIGAARAGLINTLVTDTRTARLVVDRVKAAPDGSSAIDGAGAGDDMRKAASAGEGRR